MQQQEREGSLRALRARVHTAQSSKHNSSPGSNKETGSRLLLLGPAHYFYTCKILRMTPVVLHTWQSKAQERCSLGAPPNATPFIALSILSLREWCGRRVSMRNVRGGVTMRNGGTFRRERTTGASGFGKKLDLMAVESAPAAPLRMLHEMKIAQVNNASNHM